MAAETKFSDHNLEVGCDFTLGWLDLSLELKSFAPPHSGKSPCSLGGEVVEEWYPWKGNLLINKQNSMM